MDNGLRLAASAKRLDEILREVELHVAAGRDRVARQTRFVAQAEQDGRNADSARELLLAMGETQESLEGAARQFKALAVGLALDSKLMSESEFAVMESVSAIGGAFSGRRGDLPRTMISPESRRASPAEPRSAIIELGEDPATPLAWVR